MKMKYYLISKGQIVREFRSLLYLSTKTSALYGWYQKGGDDNHDQQLAHSA